MSTLKFKVIVLGDMSVGKSCFLMRYVTNTFTINHLSTIGVDVKKKELITSKGTILLQIWDTAGQEKFRGLAPSYIRNTDGVLLIYDITERITFSNLKRWIETIQSTAQKKYKMILVGNKVDLKDKRKVNEKEARDFASNYKIEFIEASAKSGQGVENCFMKLGELLVENLKQNNEDYNKIDLGRSSLLEHKGCCSSSKKKKR